MTRAQPEAEATRTTGARSARSTTPITTCGSPKTRWWRGSRARRSTPPSRTTTRASSASVTGWATIDDLPEALELPGNRFALGVQWHPEADEASPMIAGLVDAALAHQ